MTHTLFTAAGCIRCRIAASFMDDCRISYQKSDVHGPGKELFKSFYRECRSAIIRGPEGIEFPILFTGSAVIQGLGPVLAFLQAGDALNPFVKQSGSSHGWISGLDLSAQTMPDGTGFLAVVRFLKKNGLRVQLDTNGRNPSVLASLITDALCDKIVFTLHGPALRYRDLTGWPIDESDLLTSLSLLKSAADCTILLPVQPVSTPQGPGVSITPDEAAQAAALVEKATGSKKHLFFIQPLAPLPDTGLSPLTLPQLFKYRTQCRRFMVLADIGKPV